MATKIDIDLVVMCKPMSRMTLVRLPDKPLASDLEMMGAGNKTYDEDLKEQPKEAFFYRLVHSLVTTRQRPKPVIKAPHPIVALITKLPPDQRIKHFRRLQSAEAI